MNRLYFAYEADENTGFIVVAKSHPEAKYIGHIAMGCEYKEVRSRLVKGGDTFYDDIENRNSGIKITGKGTISMAFLEHKELDWEYFKELVVTMSRGELFNDVNGKGEREMMAHDECINLYGKKVKVEYTGSHFDRNHVKGDYYLLYDEAEVYHIENASTKAVVRAFPSSSYTEAFQNALMIIDMQDLRIYKRGALHEIRYKLNMLMSHIADVKEEFLPSSEKQEIDTLLFAVDDILKWNDEDNIAREQAKSGQPPKEE